MARRKSTKHKKATVKHPGKHRTHKVAVMKPTGNAYWKKVFLRTSKTPKGG